MAPSLEEILDYLRTNFSPTADQLAELSAGWFSQAYAFNADGHDYVLRLNDWEVDFRKDAFAAAHFSSPRLPIPPILRLEHFDARRFAAITPRCPGRNIHQWDQATRQRLARSLYPRQGGIVPPMPLSERGEGGPLFDVLAELRAQDASLYPGWGLTDGNFHGLFPSWPDYLCAFYNQKFTYSLAELEGTFFEPELYQAALAAMQRLLPYLPAQKWLVHGDFGDHNLISDGERITGVLDWAEARLGDPLYDIATLDYWSEGDPYAAQWQEYAAWHGIEEPHLAERLRCYILYSAAGDLRLSAYRNDPADYRWARAKAIALI